MNYDAAARESTIFLRKIENLINEAPMGANCAGLLQAKEDAEAHLQGILDRRAAAAAERKRNSPKQRLHRALVATRREGVKVRQNVSSCCRGCISPEDLGAEEGQPYAYTFGGQGNGYRWDEHGEVATYRSPQVWEHNRTVNRLYFNHGNGAAQILADALRAEGFEVEWDGTDFETVTVVLP